SGATGTDSLTLQSGTGSDPLAVGATSAIQGTQTVTFSTGIANNVTVSSPVGSAPVLPTGRTVLVSDLSDPTWTTLVVGGTRDHAGGRGHGGKRHDLLPPGRRHGRRDREPERQIAGDVSSDEPPGGLRLRRRRRHPGSRVDPPARLAVRRRRQRPAQGRQR